MNDNVLTLPVLDDAPTPNKRRCFSYVWHYFQQMGPLSAKCLKCLKILKTPRGSTSGLMNHLRSRHHIYKAESHGHNSVSGVDLHESMALPTGSTSSILDNLRSIYDVDLPNKSNDVSEHSSLAGSSSLSNFLDIQNAEIVMPPGTAPSTNHQLEPTHDVDEPNDFPEQNSVSDMGIEEVIGRVCSESFMSFNQLATGTIQKVFSVAGKPLPTDASTIAKMFRSEHARRLEELKKMISDMTNKGRVFSLTVDESSTLEGKRFMCFNLHGNGQHHCLGMKRMFDNMSPDDVVAMIMSILNDFGLDFHNVAGITTDSALVMKKAQSDLPLLVQLCVVQVIHLAVKDCVYSPASITSPSEVEIFDAHVKDDGASDYVDPFFESEYQGYNPNKRVQETLKQVSEAMKFFKASLVRKDAPLVPLTDVLAYNKEAMQFLECPGRWNSMVRMLRCFLKMIKPIKIAYKCANKQFTISEEEVKNIEGLCKALEPIEELMIQVSGDEADLLHGDNWVRFTLHKLHTHGTYWSGLMHNKLNNRYLCRRNTTPIHLLEFLQNPDFLKNTKDMYSVPINKSKVVDLAESLHNRIRTISAKAKHRSQSWDSVSSTHSNPSASAAPDASSTKPSSVEEDFARWMKQKQVHINKSEELSLTSEIENYIETHSLTSKLRCLKETLKTMKPSSVELGRDFASLKKSISRDSASLEDSTIDGIMFLRQF